MSSTPSYALEAINVSKRFGELKALDNVSLKLTAGSFHALLGENGAGKSTLVKCIMGYYQPDAGQVLLGDREREINNPQQAMRLGIGMVYQHFTLIPNLTVAENLVLSRPELPAIIDWRSERAALEQRLKDLPFRINLDAPVNQLAAGEKQKVEIIKQLVRDVRVLILDEPTSVLTPTEADEVLGQIQNMTRTQGLSVLIITHKFREVMNFADEVTVLRKGRYAGAVAVKDANPTLLANMMVGREVMTEPLTRRAQATGKPVLEIVDLCVQDDNATPAVNGLQLQVRAGEIVGVAGVSGNGQRQLIQTLAGQRPAASGTIKVNGERYRGRRGEIYRQRVHCLPEEPLRSACVPGMSVAENMALRRFDREPYTRGHVWLDRGVMRRTAKTWIERFNVRTPGPDAAIGQLSGGNVQRAVLARELSDEVSLLVVANPCFGLDFGAVSFIHQQIMSARNRGAAVLLVSEDLDEILEMSDRMVVMSGGRLVYETTPAQADIALVGQHMAGH